MALHRPKPDRSSILFEMPNHPHDANDAPGSDARAARAYWASVTGVVVLLWLAPAIPTQDGPSHLYNTALIAELLAEAPARADVHELRFASVTNVGFLALSVPLSKLFPLWAVERTILSLHIILIAFFATAWLATTGRTVFPAAWVALAFCLPWSLFMGFYGYQLGADIALLAICLGWRTRDARVSMLAVFGAGIGALVLLFHAIAAGLLAGLLALIQLTNPRLSWLERSSRAIAVALPLLATIAFAVGSGGDGSAPQWQAPDYALMFLVTLGSLSFASQFTTCLLVAFGWGLLCLPGENPRRWDHAARYGLAGSAALVMLHFLMPDQIGGGGYVTGRFVWWIPMLSLPLLGTGAALAGRLQRELIPPALAVVAIGSTLFSAAPTARLVAEVESAALVNPVAGTLATAIFDRDPKSDAMIEPLRHLACLFVQEQGVLMTNYQARAAYFPLRFTDAAKERFPHVDINAAWETQWHRLPISALVSVDALPKDRRVLANHFESEWLDEENRVELWRKR